MTSSFGISNLELRFVKKGRELRSGSLVALPPETVVKSRKLRPGEPALHSSPVAETA
jgi:hypothetical protein